MTQEITEGRIHGFGEGGVSPSRHRPTARKALKGPANQPRTKVFWGYGNRGDLALE